MIFMTTCGLLLVFSSQKGSRWTGTGSWETWCNGAVSLGDRTKRLQALSFDKLAESRDEEAMSVALDVSYPGMNCDPMSSGEPIVLTIQLEDLKQGIRVFTDAYYAGADSKIPE